MNDFFSWIGAKQWRDGLFMFSVLAIVNLIEFFTFWYWLHGVLAVTSIGLVALSYKGGKIAETTEEDGQ